MHFNAFKNVSNTIGPHAFFFSFYSWSVHSSSDKFYAAKTQKKVIAPSHDCMFTDNIHYITIVSVDDQFQERYRQ